jgi:hypothetical protein
MSAIDGSIGCLDGTKFLVIDEGSLLTHVATGIVEWTTKPSHNSTADSRWNFFPCSMLVLMGVSLK